MFHTAAVPIAAAYLSGIASAGGRGVPLTGSDDERLIGILPTFRRTEMVGATLARLRERTRPLDHVIVVDNEGSARTEAVVRASAGSVEYLDPGGNAGFAGGVAAGMRRALTAATDDDWLVLVDDDDPPRFARRSSRWPPSPDACGLRIPGPRPSGSRADGSTGAEGGCCACRIAS